MKTKGWVGSGADRSARAHWKTTFYRKNTERKRAEEDVLLVKLDRVVVKQDVPALYFLVLVLEAFVPVLQTLSFSLDT